MISYAYDFMEVQKFHDLGIRGQGVKIAVLDTGVQKHEALTIAGGFNAYNQTLPYDANISNAHGTKVAGIIGMLDGGIAPDCELYAVKLDNGSGETVGDRFDEQIIAMDWAINNGMDVVVCSFSSDGDSKERKDAFKRADDAGIAIFCSANNRQGSNPITVDTMRYPARYPFVISVANIDSNKKRYATSSVGTQINFASGGVDIMTTTTDNAKNISNKYQAGTGTSYANPAVAGLYALYKQKYPWLSKKQLLQKMYVNVENIGSPFLFGAGIPKYPEKEYQNIYINDRSDN